MNFKILLRLLPLALVCLSSLHALQLSNRTGSTIEVEILAIEAERIQIQMSNGQITWLQRERLSDDSQALIASQATEEREVYLTINSLLGIDLFADSQLWDDSVDHVAERLHWPQESETAYQTSYRYYPPSEYRILDTRPYSAVLYGHSGKPQRISIVFANKGDFPFSDPPSTNEIATMEQAIEQDVEHLQALLSQQFGEPERQQYGAGRGIKQLIERWDWKGHAFLLAAQDGEYTNLKIIPTDLADNKGRGDKLSDASLRQLTTENIVHVPNGDVFINNIPMVNQGPKGYCVPATFERYLRYMQIPADMYILAMAGQTAIGGGTSLSQTIESIDGYVSSHNRSMKKINREIKLRTVQKYIDRGLPIIWTMFSSRDYNEFVNERSIQRLQTSHWDEWKTRCKDESRKVELRKDFLSAHACMIIGYNKETEEVAVSDSWGPNYALRWVPVDQAEQVSQGSIYLIEF
ncbi:C39 family peptidase [Coraliomargarita sp. SDUM461004]|uniref:C39 family peptidase n=1 Tax=Thalassobacterium sedimentorum TaxID=3041258 RepID=A0ABU1ANR8_9BACT|nr:C39 family peptidase [Coraliomargarita sp. SDUM461004]MDQ8195505.1 C39 family peptidase [Coraliomargarita sp. SDUM461004]